MQTQRAFLQTGLKAAELALADTAARANLHLRPETLTKSLKRRCMSQFRVLATLIRRLIFLMALSLDPGPLPPRETGRAAPEADADGVEDVTASFGAFGQGIRIAPVSSGVSPESFRGSSGACLSGPVEAAPVLARWAALARVLKEPEAYAERLAVTIARWQAKGEAKPLIVPMAGCHRLGAEIGLVASMLPDLLTRALEGWPDTG